MKRNIVVAEPMSSSFGFIGDIHDRGFEPVILETYIPESPARDLLDAERKIKYGRIPFPVKIIRETTDYSETLAAIRALDPLFVLPGGEEGVVIANRLAFDLGLRGNPYSRIDCMTRKGRMQECLKDAGMRYIRGAAIHTEEEAAAFYDTLDTPDTVLKHSHSCASVGLCFCTGRDALLRAFREEIGKADMFGEYDRELIVQERIFGTEYVVNTVSIDGRAHVSSVWQYEKRPLENGSNIYISSFCVPDPDPELVDYALRTVRAIGIQNGPVHGEYMVDEKGPVLIEVNCRVMGGNNPADYLDRVYTHHETDLVLDAYLKPEQFESLMAGRSVPVRKGIVKDITRRESQDISSSPVVTLMRHMKSLFTGNIISAGSADRVEKTIDLETEQGLLYMVSDDDRITEKEYALLHRIEDEEPRLFYTDGSGLFDIGVEAVSELPDEKDTICLTCENKAAGKDPARYFTPSASFGASGPVKKAVLDIDAIANVDAEDLTDAIFRFCENIEVGGFLTVPSAGVLADEGNRRRLDIILAFACLYPAAGKAGARLYEKRDY